MYDANEVLEKLTDDDIIALVEKLGIETIIKNDDELFITNTICHNVSGGTHKLYYYKESKRFQCFTACGSLSLYDLVMQRHGLHGEAMRFSDAVQWVAIESGNAFGFSDNSFADKTVSEEMKWMNRFKKKKAVPPTPDVYSEILLDVFDYHGEHYAFTQDYISKEAMDRFNIRFDWGNNALIIPHRYHKNGKIMGLMSRNLNKAAADAGFKYVPTQVQKKQYGFSKHLNLYGLWENKENIKALKKVALFESEKSVLQCDTYFGEENNFSVALGGKFLSDEHLKILIELGVEQIIINFDKDFEDINSEEAKEVAEHIKEIGQKLSPYMRVFTTFDRQGLLDYKDSPSDKGRETLIRLFDTKEEIFNKVQ